MGGGGGGGGRSFNSASTFVTFSLMHGNHMVSSCKMCDSRSPGTASAADKVWYISCHQYLDIPLFREMWFIDCL